MPLIEPPRSPEDTRPLTPTRATPAPLIVLLVMGLIGLGVVSLFGLFLLVSQPQMTTPITVYLRVEGRTYAVSTAARTVREVIAEQRMTLYENTVVVPELETRLSPEMTIAVSAERSVSVTIDGETSIFRTVFDHPLDILNSVGFMPETDDRISVNGRRIEVVKLVDYPLPANAIVVQNTIPITIIVDEETRLFETSANTVGEALAEAGITLYLGDRVQPGVDSLIEVEMQITVERSQPIMIRVDGTTIETRTIGKTVSEALAEAGVILNGLDYAVPPENTRLSVVTEIRVVRVTERVETEQQPIAFEVVYQADAELELDQQQVVQAGVNGVEQRNIRVRYEDSIEVSRVDEGAQVTQQPVNQIVAYGTKIVLRTIDTPEGPREYWRKLRVYATSYHPEALGGDDITATGRKLVKGIVGIDPKLIPYDSSVYVEGYGTGIAADTGGPRRSRYWIDLGYSDADWVSWSRWVDVYLLTPLPDDFPVILPPR